MKKCSEINSPMPTSLYPTEMNYALQGYPGETDDEIRGPDNKEHSDIDSDADFDPTYYVCVEMQYHDNLVQLEKAHQEKLNAKDAL